MLADSPVTALDLGVGPANNSPQVIADPRDARFVVLANRIDGPRFGCSLQVSVDGGRIWAPAKPVATMPLGAQECYAPQVAFDSRGRLYFLFVGLAGAGNAPMGVFLTRSSDYAHTFAAPHRVLGPEKYMVVMAIDQSLGDRGRLHLAWVNVSGPAPLGGFPPIDNPILSSYSDDGGRTFSAPVGVSDPARQRVVAPALVIGPDHQVVIVYYDLGHDARDYQGLEGPTWPGRWSLVVSVSGDAGRRFTKGAVVDDQVVPPGRVSLIYTMAPAALAVDQQDRLFAAWTDARNGDPDVLLRRSLDAGQHWQAVLRLNDDRMGDGASQYLPHLSVAPDGRIDAVFLDRRNDPKDIYNNTYYTYSSDAGARFSSNVKLTNRSSDSLVGQRYAIPSARGLVELGSRLGLLSLDSGVVAAWPDTRNSIGMADASGGPIAQDIFSTQVEVPPMAGLQVGWWPGLVAVLVVLGLAWAAVVAGRRRRRPTGQGPTSRQSVVGGDEQPSGLGEVGVTTTPGRRRRRVSVALLVAVAGAVSAAVWFLSPASTSRPASASVLVAPVRTSAVSVVMREYRFEYRVPTIAGRIVFSVRNAGRQPHQLSLEQIPVNFPLTIDQQLRGKVRRAFPGIAYLPDLQPDQSTIFAVDLGPGRFALVSFARDGMGKTDAAKGMSSEFRLHG